MEAYVFVRNADESTVEKLRRLAESGDSPVRFATGVSGSYDAIVFITAEDFRAVESTVKGEIRRAGASWTETALQVNPLPLPMPKWHPPMAFEAFVQCRVDPGAAEEVATGLAALPGAMGVAIVAGSFDVLFEAGADTFDELAGNLMQMPSVAGLRWTRSSIAAFDAAQSSD